MGAEAEDIGGDSEQLEADVSVKAPADSAHVEPIFQALDAEAPPVRVSFKDRLKGLFLSPAKNNSAPVDISKLLFQLPSKGQLRQLSRIRHVLVHSTSIDPVGDYSASALEILDDRIKLDSLTAVLFTLLAKSHGAPLRALYRSLRLDGDPLVHSIVNVIEPTSHSISGEVSGAEITIGDEEFLLQRGVLLDSLADTLVEPGQVGFYLLIAIGDAIVARVLIAPPRIGDGRSLVTTFQERQIPVHIFTLGSTSPDTMLFASDALVSAEQVYAIDSPLHLDSFLEERKPFALITTDPDCASYVGGHGSVALLGEREIALGSEHILEFSSFDLRGLAHVYAHARRLVRREKIVFGISIFVGVLALGLMLYFFR